jgi:hypothetical protein
VRYELGARSKGHEWKEVGGRRKVTSTNVATNSQKGNRRLCPERGSKNPKEREASKIKERREGER